MARRPTALKMVGATIKFIFYSIIAMICGILLWRIFFSTKIPAAINTLNINDNLAAAYDIYGDELEIFNQSQAGITRAEENYGYFSVVEYIIIPGANQVQLIFRYNNSTLEYLAEDYGLDEIPDRELDLFDLSLVKTTDLTPENKDDNINREHLREERYFPSEIISERTLMYNFKRVIFDGVSVEDAIGIFFDIFYAGDIDYEGEAYGTLCLYDREMYNNPVKLTSSEKTALINAAKKLPLK